MRVGDRVADEFGKYERLRDAGATAAEVARAGDEDGLDGIVLLRMLRVVFGLDLRGAKEAKTVGLGLGTSLEEYQNRVILPVVQRLVELEARRERRREAGISFAGGERVMVDEDYHWAAGAMGTVGPHPPRKVATLQGERTHYWVTFDEPQMDADGDGPYEGGQIDGEYLTPAARLPGGYLDIG